MSKPQTIEEKIDEIVSNHVYSITALGRKDNNEAKQALIELIQNDVIGEDVDVPTQPRHAGKSYAYIGNLVRSEQRKRLKG